MTTINTTCPNCDEAISMNVPETAFSEQLMTFLPAVHCHECATIKTAQFRTEKRINFICDKIRASGGKSEKLDKLEAALKAQYSSAKMLRAHLESRSSISRQKVALAADANNRLPW
jgi:uncharacterized Zn finger protein